MTGYATGNLAMSAMTVASLADMGYEVDLSLADPFPKSQLSSSCTCSCNRRSLRNATSVLKEPRALSEEGRDAARAWGQDHLQKKKQEHEENPYAGVMGEGVEYIGDKMVVVIYKESGVIYDVIVNITSVPAEGYDAVFDLQDVPCQYLEAFQSAAERWSEVITGDLEDVAFTADLSEYTSCTRAPVLIDDMFICADVRYIDGPGKVLGYAGPDLARVVNGVNVIPFIGQISIDSADASELVESSMLESVIVSALSSRKWTSADKLWPVISSHS